MTSFAEKLGYRVVGVKTMIILYGEIDMLIKRIHIVKLHGQHDYKIEFDPELTFLHGANGCGKTTVLNILAAVVTGKLYNLVDYSFERIDLFYSDSKDKEDKIQIKIDIVEKNKRSMVVCFDGYSYEIEDINNLKERMFRKSEEDNIERTFSNIYPFVKDIISKFNYVYLPLSRYGYDRFDERDYYRYGYSRRHYYEIQQNPYSSYLNESLRYISELIRNSCMNINIQENKVNDKFRNDVLSSMIRVSSDMHIWQIIEEIAKFEWDEVLKSKEAYIKTLREIGVYDDKLQKEIEAFFEAFKSAYDDYIKQKNDDNEKPGIRIDLAWQYAEFLKIRNIAELAKENEKIKDKIRQPKMLFEELINDFFLSSGTHKKIVITSEGQVIFETKAGKLHLTDLSSGEKQIVITFASLIFGFKGKGKGIFIVDEPEASLHLEWQNKFVPAILKTNKNMQLIFATHSPELIGEYRNKAVRLK